MCEIFLSPDSIVILRKINFFFINKKKHSYINNKNISYFDRGHLFQHVHFRDILPFNESKKAAPIWIHRQKKSRKKYPHCWHISCNKYVFLSHVF